MKKIIDFLSFLTFLTMARCSTVNDELCQEALHKAADNVSEINRVINNYSGEKNEVAGYLVRSMIGRYSSIGAGIDSIEMMYRKLPNGKSWQFDSLQLSRIRVFEKMPVRDVPDLENLNAEYLINNIDDAWKYKESMLWNNNLDIHSFNELILPYRNGNENITDWRNSYRKKYRKIQPRLKNVRNSVTAASIVSKAIGRMRFNQQVNSPHRTALDLLEAPIGYCREDCDRTIFAMRAFGIPVAIDQILVSPDHGKSHFWNVVYDNDDKIFRMFDNYRNPPTKDSIHDDQRSKGKVYRQCNGFNFDRLKKFTNLDEVPVYLKNPRLTDVTSEYFGLNQATIDIDDMNRDIYLGIFTSQDVLPIDVAERRGNKAIFKNIEPWIIYFPIKIEDSKYQICGTPFILTDQGKTILFNPDDNTKRKIRINRKMPVTFNLKEKLSSIIGTTVSLGKTSEGPWKEIDSITRMPEHAYYKVSFPPDMNCRYIRLRSTLKRKPEFGEIIVSKDLLAMDKLPLSFCNIKKKGKWNNLIDGDILSWYHYVAGNKGVILKIESDIDSGNIFIIPRNDDNYVVPGQEYELFYFSNSGWRSLGRKIANDFYIDYEVPDNAVLWLRNNTKGSEEQIFIYRNGKQLFNSDLRKIKF